MIIIAFTGAKQSGKDTGADFIEEELYEKYYVKRDSFAKPLKEALSIITGYSIEKLEDLKNTPAIAVGQYTVRKAMQKTGDAFKAIFGDDVFAKLLVERIKFYENAGYEVVIISDLRFKIEDKVLRDFVENDDEEHLYIPIRVIRDKVEVDDTHASELEWVTLGDEVIENNGTYIEYFNKLNGILEKYKLK